MTHTEKLYHEANVATARCDEAYERYKALSEDAEKKTFKYSQARYQELSDGDPEKMTLETVYPQLKVSK